MVCIVYNNKYKITLKKSEKCELQDILLLKFPQHYIYPDNISTVKL